MKLYWEEVKPLEFENLCYDLLSALGFHNLKKRGGTADRGRDIEANWLSRDPAGDIHLQKWFIECKFYKKGIPTRELYEKIQWADVEKLDVLLFMTNSHLTAQAKDWIEKIQNEKNYFIRIWENEKIEGLLAKYPSLLNKYFPKSNIKLMYTPYIRSIINEYKGIREFYIPPKISYKTYSGEKKVSTIDDLINHYDKIILIGRIGGGKTVILKYLSYIFARRILHKKNDSFLVPIYLDVDHLRKNNILSLVVEKIQSSASDITERTINGHLEQGWFLILIDEVGFLQYFNGMLEDVQSFVKTFYKNKFVLASQRIPIININAIIGDIEFLLGDFQE